MKVKTDADSYNEVKDAILAIPQNQLIKHPIDKRIETVYAWIVQGTDRGTEKITGIGHRTICGWRQTEWWKIAVDWAKQQKQEELDAKFTGIIMTAAGQLQDRLDNGDVKLTRDGEQVRVPMSAHDLAISGIAVPFDKRTQLRGDRASKAGQQNAEALLEKIAERMEAIASGQLTEKQGGSDLEDGEFYTVEGDSDAK